VTSVMGRRVSETKRTGSYSRLQALLLFSVDSIYRYSYGVKYKPKSSRRG
jgi:hypothetical protein